VTVPISGGLSTAPGATFGTNVSDAVRAAQDSSRAAAYDITGRYLGGYKSTDTTAFSTTAQGNPKTADQSAKEIAIAFNAGSIGNTLVLDDLARTANTFGLSPAETQALADKYGLPTYAVGTNYIPYDQIAQLHEGEAVVPKAYNPAAGGQNNDRLERLVEGLTKEVQRLQTIVNDGNKNTKRVADNIDNVTEGGNAMRSRTV